MRERRTRRTILSAVAVLGVLALAACTDDSEQAEPDQPSTSSPTSGSTTTSPEPTPTVEPATGPILKQPVATVHLPEKWELTENQSAIQASGSGPFSEGSSLITFGSLPAINTTDTPDVLARDSARRNFNKRAKVLPEETIDGVAMGHVTGIDFGDIVEQFITLYEGDQVSIEFSFRVGDYSAQQRREVVDQVMASWKWR